MKAVLTAWIIALLLWGTLIKLGMGTGAERRQGASQPSAISTVEIPFAGSVKDAAGATWAIAGTARVSKEEAPPPPPPPPPVGLTFGVVTTGVDQAVVTARPSGWICTLHGSGFPTSGTRRLQVAGRIAPEATLIWNASTIVFTVPPGPPSATGPTTGPFEIYLLVNNQWTLLGRGGSFTILPDPPAAKKR